MYKECLDSLVHVGPQGSGPARAALLAGLLCGMSAAVRRAAHGGLAQRGSREVLTAHVFVHAGLSHHATARLTTALMPHGNPIGARQLQRGLADPCGARMKMLGRKKERAPVLLLTYQAIHRAVDNLRTGCHGTCGQAAETRKRKASGRGNHRL